MCYNYANEEKEYVFCIKGRPFPCLVSPYIPTPTATLLDHNFVRELGLKMTDLQCQKFSFSGFKMRILGKVSITAQCIHDGISSGAFHIKANVVQDLAKNLDSECVAGAKMEAQLKGNKSPSGTPTPTARSPPPTPAASPRTLPPRAARQPPQSPPRSPPGFPKTPQYSASPGVAISPPLSTIPVMRVSADGRKMSPMTANVRALGLAFNNADIQPDDEEVTCALDDVDQHGALYDDDDGNTVYDLTNGLRYQYGHGRKLCSRVKCYSYLQQAANRFPSNCGFNNQWLLPDKFRPCSDYCSGGFCPCLRRYDNSNFNNRNVERGKRN